VSQRGLESVLQHTQGHWNFFWHICFI